MDDRNHLRAFALAMMAGINPAEQYHWLSKEGSTYVDGSGGTLNVELINGDCDGSNYVNTDDYLIFNAAFDTQIGDPAYNDRADLSGDGYVNTDDYLILSGSIDTAGDE